MQEVEIEVWEEKGKEEKMLEMESKVVKKEEHEELEKEEVEAGEAEKE